MKIIEILEDDQYISKVSEEKRMRISKKVNNLRAGLHTSAPLVCNGPERCLFLTHCPIPEISDEGDIDYGDKKEYPINQLCVIEAQFMKYKLLEYLNFLKIDTENPIELSLANELALCDLWKNRATMILSNGDRQNQGQDFLRVDVIMISDNGQGQEKLNTGNTTQLHPLLVLIDRIEARRIKLISELDQSRKAKNAIAMKLTKQKENSKLLEEISAMRKMLEGQTHAQPLLSDEEIEIKD